MNATVKVDHASLAAELQECIVLLESAICQGNVDAKAQDLLWQLRKQCTALRLLLDDLASEVEGVDACEAAFLYIPQLTAMIRANLS